MVTMVKRRRSKVGLAVVLLVLVMGLQLATPPQAFSNGYPALNDYANWSTLWWQWAYTEPWPTNPVWDTSVQAPYAGLNQQGPVWFLGGHFDKSIIDNFPVIRGSENNPIHIPNNKYLFFPTVAVADVNGIEVKDAAVLIYLFPLKR